MAHRHLFTFACPCCGKRVEVDTRTGKARAVRAEDAAPGGLDELLESHKQDSARLSDAFDSATREEGDAAARLDELLDRAKKEARDNPDENPLRPFDLD